MKQSITGYYLDKAGHWVAQLACGHHQHVPHNPPWVNRLWVITHAGRLNMLGHPLECPKCDAGAPANQQTFAHSDAPSAGVSERN